MAIMYRAVNILVRSDVQTYGAEDSEIILMHEGKEYATGIKEQSPAHAVEKFTRVLKNCAEGSGELE